MTLKYIITYSDLTCENKTKTDFSCSTEFYFGVKLIVHLHLRTRTSAEQEPPTKVMRQCTGTPCSEERG